MSEPRTMFDKIWHRHVVVDRDDGQTLLYIDRHLIHDSSFHAFNRLAMTGRGVRRPDATVGTPDHYTPTHGRSLDDIPDEERRDIVRAFDRNTEKFDITGFGLGDERNGIVHVVGPEQGFTQPGITLVCGDSHTSTHGALGAISFGIGASEVGHVMATQTIWQRKPKTMRISVDGRRGDGVTGKDVILAIIAKIGAGGALGHAVEYAGSTVEGLSMEERLTVCNMSIEAGARTGMIAPDDKTYAYLEGRPYAPRGEEWTKAMAYWRSLPTDAGAAFDTEVALDGAAIEPMVTWGTSPEHAVPITGAIPDPKDEPDPHRSAGMQRALDYIGLSAGTEMVDIAIDQVFIGSCTNSRIEDLRAAAAVAKGRKTAIPAMISPGSMLVRKQAEAEGLDRIFQEAGFEWRYAGCSRCVGMNGDTVDAGRRCASTSNRNFAGRQGPGSRTHLLSPAMAAAAAVTGRLTDVRQL